MQFLQTLTVLAFATFLPFLLYAWSKCGTKNFDPIAFFWYGRTRIVFAVVLILVIAGAVSYDLQMAAAILTPLGFDVGKSTAGVGLALSLTLIAAVRGDEGKEDA